MVGEPLVVRRLGSPSSPSASQPRPDHHIAPTDTASGWSSYLPSWAPAPGSARPPKDLAPVPPGSSAVGDATGFRNPWPSWHKPTQTETWEALRWGQDDDSCIQLAASHLPSSPPLKPESDRRPNFSDIDDWPRSTGAQAACLLRVQEPDFAFDPAVDRAKVTWLGHAGILLQLPPLREAGEPVRCLFDPIFSMRSSPTQAAGPVRAYPPPCPVQSLPPVDALFISHNHYDHLDHDTIMSLWRSNQPRMRIFVPLANLQWFVDCGIPADRITELDWWDSVALEDAGPESKSLKISCTPAQHSSGRSGFDSDSTLWSSWHLEHSHPSPFRVFFAGDSGYQFHASPAWPPRPPTAGPPTNAQPAAGEKPGDSREPFPPCPAFDEIRSRLGPPHLLLLPVAVGATFAYFRSFFYLPDWLSPFPRHSDGLTAATHMPPWDALRVLRAMTAVGPDEAPSNEAPVAVAMHWGTFVTDPADVLKTLGQLEWACRAHGVRFLRELPEKGEETAMKPPFWLSTTVRVSPSELRNI